MQNAPTLMGVCGPQNKLLIYLSSTFSWGGGGLVSPSVNSAHTWRKTPPYQAAGKGMKASYGVAPIGNGEDGWP